MVLLPELWLEDVGEHTGGVFGDGGAPTKQGAVLPMPTASSGHSLELCRPSRGARRVPGD